MNAQLNQTPSNRPLPAETSVVIVGAGPAGLAAAITLTAAKVDVLLLDRQAEGANTSRAAVVHARTLEVLDEFGVSGELRDRGIPLRKFTVRDGGRALARVGFGGLPTAFPFALMIPQDVTEAVLLSKLRALGGDVHRPYEVCSVRPDDDGVSVVVQGDSGESAEVRAQYVIGADGMHSTVRDQAGIGFDGAAYPESFVLADVRMAWPLPRDEVSLLFSPDGVTVIAPLPGDRFRVVATVDEAPQHPTGADVEAILRARGPRGGTIRVEEVLWSSRFRVHHRIADRYRAGRILLAGDAAHVHSPAGGQGMNTGIQDAVTLGHALAAVLGGAPDSVLDDYAATRRPIAKRVVNLTDKMTRLANLRSPFLRALRNAALPLLTALPPVRRTLATNLAELNLR